MSSTIFTVQGDAKTLIAKRTFPATTERVWRAYTNPELLAKWWGPRGWQTENKHMELTEGGYWHYGMRCIDPAQKEWHGKTSWARITYTSINPNESLEYVDAFCNEHGEIEPGMPVSHTTLSFLETSGSTAVASKTSYASGDALSQVLDMGMKEGFTQTWDRLEELLGTEDTRRGTK